MENLSSLHSIVSINLSNNLIKKISGLNNLKLLKNLDVSNNLIADTYSCEGVL